MRRLKKMAAVWLLLSLLLPGVTISDDQPGEQSAEYVTDLEWKNGEPLLLSGDVEITVTGFEMGSRFRYYPAGGFSTAALRAKAGYQLLCLYVYVDNRSGVDLETQRLMDMQLCYGKDYESGPRNTFFYRTSSGAFAGGATAIRAGARVEGCLLFALPMEAETSGRRIYLIFQDGETAYQCELRPASGLLLEESEEAVAS